MLNQLLRHTLLFDGTDITLGLRNFTLKLHFSLVRLIKNTGEHKSVIGGQHNLLKAVIEQKHYLIGNHILNFTDELQRFVLHLLGYVINILAGADEHIHFSMLKVDLLQLNKLNAL